MNNYVYEFSTDPVINKYFGKNIVKLADKIIVDGVIVKNRYKEIDMKKEINIQIPEGYEVDEEKSTFTHVVFKKKETYCNSFIEYCSNSNVDERRNLHCILPTKELHDKMEIFSRLLCCRHQWLKIWSKENGLDEIWEPDWTNGSKKYCIKFNYNNLCVPAFFYQIELLSFPNEDLAKKFITTFKDDLLKAKGIF